MPLLGKVDRVGNSYITSMKVIFLFTSLDIFLLLSQITMVKTFHTSMADLTYLTLALNESMHFLLSSQCLLHVFKFPQQESVAKAITIFI